MFHCYFKKMRPGVCEEDNFTSFFRFNQHRKNATATQVTILSRIESLRTQKSF